jgi:hypothetical protein
MHEFIEQQRIKVGEYKKDEELAQLREQVAALTGKIYQLYLANNTLTKAVRDMAYINLKLCDKLDAHNIPLDDHHMTPDDKKFLHDLGIKNEE